LHRVERGSFKVAGKIDLTNIASVQLTSVTQNPVIEDYMFELSLDSADGQKTGEVIRKADPENAQEQPIFRPLTINITINIEGRTHDLFIVSRPVSEKASESILLSTITFKTDK